MKESPRIAIILPIFRNHLQLPEAVQSIIDQSVADDFPLELVMIDDGSNDSGRVWSRIQDMERKIKSERSSIKVRTIKRVRNDGPSFARILGIAKTTAPWICYLDNDDFFHLDHIKNLWRHITEFANKDTDLILSYYETIKTKEAGSQLFVNPQKICDQFPTPALAAQTQHITDTIGICHSRELYDRMGGWPPFILSGEDDVFVRRLIDQSKHTDFNDKLAGTKRIYAQGQGVCNRRFDSGLYIQLDREHEDGPNGQYLDHTSPMDHFIDSPGDPEYVRRNLRPYVYSLLSSKVQ
jgi:glycosyltransferase involved in cell wall biosynthesis